MTFLPFGEAQTLLLRTPLVQFRGSEKVTWTAVIKELPSSDEEGWRAERRGGAEKGLKGWRRFGKFPGWRQSLLEFTATP